MSAVEQALLHRLIAQPVREQTARRLKVEQAARLLDEAFILAEGGMLMEACARTGQARQLAQEIGLI